MERKSLIKTGLLLSKKALKLSYNYHSKSNNHDILGYESSILKAKCDFLNDGKLIPTNLEESALLSDWGKQLALELPELTNSIKEFYQEYEKLL